MVIILTYHHDDPGLCKSGYLIPTYPGICQSRHLIPTYPGLSPSTKLVTRNSGLVEFANCNPSTFRSSHCDLSACCPGSLPVTPSRQPPPLITSSWSLVVALTAWQSPRPRSPVQTDQDVTPSPSHGRQPPARQHLES